MASTGQARESRPSTHGGSGRARVPWDVNPVSSHISTMSSRHQELPMEDAAAGAPPGLDGKSRRITHLPHLFYICFSVLTFP